MYKLRPADIVNFNAFIPEGTEGSPIVITYILFCVRTRILDFQFKCGFCRFGTMKMFYPPKGLCKAEPNGVHLTVFPFIVLGKGVWTFRFSGGNPPF